MPIISVNIDSEEMLQWLEKQSNKSNSIRVLISNEITTQKKFSDSFYDICNNNESKDKLPSQAEMMRIIPEIIRNYMSESGNNQMSVKQIYIKTAEYFNISASLIEQRSEITNDNIFQKNVRFCLLALKNAQIISSKKRGYYEIRS